MNAAEGDAHPVGALAAGTLINSIETYPGDGAQYATNAGAACTIVRQQGDYTILQTAHKHEYAIKRECMATVGRVSHPEWKDKTWLTGYMPIRYGIKHGTGQWHRKDGYCGRKAHPMPPLKT